MRPFVKKTGMPERNERQVSEFPGRPLEKLRLPARGRILLIPKKPFEANHEKAFSVEMNFPKGFSCTKVRLGLL